MKPKAYISKFLTDGHWVFNWFLLLLSYLFTLWTFWLFIELKLLLCIPVNGHCSAHGLLLFLPELAKSGLITLL